MIEIHVGNCLESLKSMPEKSVHCAVTSPPYWGLRSYHLTRWIGGDPQCEHKGKAIRGENAPQYWDRPSRQAQKYRPICRYCGAEEVSDEGGIGLEPTFEQHVDNLMEVFDEVHRVLRDDAVFWLNYGDRYYTRSGPGIENGMGFGTVRKAALDSQGKRFVKNLDKHSVFDNKQLMQMPARIAIAMQDRGWILRSEIIWHKNAMPESVKDRPTNSHEKMFLFAKQPKYYYDHVAVSTPAKNTNLPGKRTHGENLDRNDNDMGERIAMNGAPLTANLRNVWKISTASFKGAHFAVFPPALVEPCIKAGTSEKGVCSECGAPYERHYELDFDSDKEEADPDRKWFPTGEVNGMRDRRKGSTTRQTKEWQPTCECDADIVPAVVLDPFGGSGTTGLVADRLHRNAILCEISEEYANLAKKRLIEDDPLRCKVTLK